MLLSINRDEVTCGTGLRSITSGPDNDSRLPRQLTDEIFLQWSNVFSKSEKDAGERER